MVAQTTIDDRTAEVLRTAIAAAQTGRMTEACQIAERGLAQGGDPAALHALIGAFLRSSGQFSPSLVHLRIAHDARPGDHRITENLAIALVATERYEEAYSLLTEEVVTTNQGTPLQRLRGFAAQMSGRYAIAVEAYERFLQAQPDDWESWNNLGNSRISAGDLDGGVEALRRAVELNPREAPCRLNLARVLRDIGQFSEAEAQYRSMVDDFPDEPEEPLGDLVGLLRIQGREHEAKGILEGALLRGPRNVKLMVALGQQYLVIIDYNGAEQNFRRALSLDPSNEAAFGGLAEVFEHVNPDRLSELLREAENAGVDERRKNYIEALIARRAKAYRAGVDAILRVPDDFDAAGRWQLEGQLRDGLGEYEAAFEAFQRMNEAHVNDSTQPLRRAAELRDFLRREFELTTAKWFADWAAPPVNPSRRSPTFVVGFPRSGTTLLDTMLMGHPDVEVLEERPVLAQIRDEIGSFDHLARLDEASVCRLQDRYFEIAREHTPLREGSRLVDKSPLHMQHVAQIHRLFPEAQFILALRHPADVVLSCFMSNFRLNSSMSNFLRLDTAAEFYDLTFSIWENARAIFPVTVHTVTYERMIENPAAALRPVIAGLGLDWNEGILDHQSTAKRRGLITTASYAQVTEPLYRKAAGRWLHYRKHLEPVLPILRPWIEKFGYDL